MNKPIVPPGFVEWLEGVFRDARLPLDASVSHRDIDVRIGQRSVIERIRAEYARQQEEFINPHRKVR